MKTIKDLRIKTTYTVCLSEVEVSDEIYNALCNAHDEGGRVPDPDECCCHGNHELAKASEWLSDNIQESDAMEWEFEIEDIVD